MDGNNLLGALPTNVGEMAALQVLDLSSNFLTGFMPTELGALPFIRELILSNNFITGTMPTEVGNMLTLEVLNLEGPTTQGLNIGGTIPTQLGFLPFLRKLFRVVSLFVCNW